MGLFFIHLKLSLTPTNTGFKLSKKYQELIKYFKSSFLYLFNSEICVKGEQKRNMSSRGQSGNTTCKTGSGESEKKERRATKSAKQSGK